ncbi:LysE family transporter [Rhodobacterales bacterium HKCCE2091]|nr:LysE family transporter [Rhodobacterales bacterium HKCCE2091]
MGFLGSVDWLSFLAAMVLIELTPGPNMGWLAALSAQAGRRTGMWAVLGITVGLSVQVLAAATGLSALAAGWGALYDLLRWAGVAYMLYLAWCAWAESAENAPAQVAGESSFRRGLISNVLNPKALVFYVAVVGQFTEPSAGGVWFQILVLGAFHIFIAFAVHSGIVLLGAAVGERIERWRRAVPVRLTFALALVVVAVWIGVSTG